MRSDPLTCFLGICPEKSIFQLKTGTYSWEGGVPVFVRTAVFRKWRCPLTARLPRNSRVRLYAECRVQGSRTQALCGRSWRVWAGPAYSSAGFDKSAFIAVIADARSHFIHAFLPSGGVSSSRTKLMYVLIHFAPRETRFLAGEQKSYV